MCISFQLRLGSGFLAAHAPRDIICYISTISKHLLEKSEAIWCLSCLRLSGNVTWFHTNTSSHSYPPPSLSRMESAAGKVTRPGSAAAPPPPGRPPSKPALRHWLRGLSVSRGARSIWVQTRSRSAGLPAWICCRLREGLPWADSQYVGALSLAGSRRPGDPSSRTGDLVRRSDSTHAPMEFQHTYCAIIISYLAGASLSAAQI